MADSLLILCRIPLVRLWRTSWFYFCCVLQQCFASAMNGRQGTIFCLLLCSNQFMKQEAGSCVDIKKFAASKVCQFPTCRTAAGIVAAAGAAAAAAYRWRCCCCCHPRDAASHVPGLGPCMTISALSWTGL